MNKKIIYSIFFCLTFLLLQPVQAQNATETPPEMNPICWQHDDCIAARKDILDATGIRNDDSEILRNQLEEGWLEMEKPCDKKGWGKCLPANLTKTEIAFGGDNSFVDVGEFLEKNYNYLIGVAAILAVAMIVVAGFQWVASGGNSETISGAKKRIAGAIVGLFIAYMSYFILNTINPALTKLRLPQTWLIRQMQLAPTFCNGIKVPSTTLAYAGQGSNLIPFANIKAEDFKIIPDLFHRQDGVIREVEEGCFKAIKDLDWVSRSGCWGAIFTDLKRKFSPLEKNLLPICGHKYYWKESPNTTCQGDICEPVLKNVLGRSTPVWVKRSCAINRNVPPQQDGSFEYACIEGAIVGVLRDPQRRFGDSPLESMWVAEVCENGKVNEKWGFKAAGRDITEYINNESEFIYPFDNLSASDYCDNNGGTAGAYLILNLDDEYDIAGIFDDDYAVGCKPGGSSDCSINLAAEVWKKSGVQVTGDNNEESDFREYIESTGSMSVAAIRDYLIPIDEIRSGKVVEITLTNDFKPD